MLNTDGNVKYIDAPCVPIKDEVTVEGRITKRKFAWDVFKEAIAELEKKQNDFETIVVDLLEDTYEHCRLWCYDHLGIEHESDNSFKAWDFVRTEFLSTIKKLMNLDYNVVLISHEDSSKDVTKKSGDKITAIKPNVNDKVALKVAGMVDIVGRVINDDGERTISFKTNEVIFGGGRLSLKALEIPCEYKDLMSVYEGVATVEEPQRKPKAEPKQEAKPEPVENENGYPADWDEVKPEPELKPAADAERAGYGDREEKPRRTRRVRG
jgi:phage nucleotide-binding protein